MMWKLKWRSIAAPWRAPKPTLSMPIAKSEQWEVVVVHTCRRFDDYDTCSYTQTAEYHMHVHTLFSKYGGCQLNDGKYRIWPLFRVPTFECIYRQVVFKACVRNSRTFLCRTSGGSTLHIVTGHAPNGDILPIIQPKEILHLHIYYCSGIIGLWLLLERSWSSLLVLWTRKLKVDEHSTYARPLVEFRSPFRRELSGDNFRR